MKPIMKDQSEAKLYPAQDIMQLDRDGNYYMRHVSAMTGEGLHAKSDIAAQLGWRDREIDRLRAEMAANRDRSEKHMGIMRDSVAHWKSEARRNRQDTETQQCPFCEIGCECVTK